LFWTSDGSEEDATSFPKINDFSSPKDQRLAVAMGLRTLNNLRLRKINYFSSPNEIRLAQAMGFDIVDDTTTTNASSSVFFSNWLQNHQQKKKKLINNGKNQDGDEVSEVLPGMRYTSFLKDMQTANKMMDETKNSLAAEHQASILLAEEMMSQTETILAAVQGDEWENDVLQ
jgi:hypothetical protein